MDDELYRQTRDALGQPRCLYEKAIQYGYFSCRHAQKLSLGEREGIQCRSTSAFVNCDCYYKLTLSKSGFALGESRRSVHLTFNKAMKVQIGGMQGAMKLYPSQDMDSPVSAADSPPDIADCLEKIKPGQGGFDTLSFSRIIPSIQQFSLRREKRGRSNRTE